jgi:transposase
MSIGSAFGIIFRRNTFLMIVPDANRFSTRRVLEAVLWILNTGAQWHMLPQSNSNYKTVHRRFQLWCYSEVLRQVLPDVANELRDKGVLDAAPRGGLQMRRSPARGLISKVRVVHPPR